MIGGWLPGEGRRSGRIGALLMGYYDHEPASPELRFAGKLGTGFDAKELDRLEKLLRHPSYKGLREDKRALDVVLEQPEPPKNS